MASATCFPAYLSIIIHLMTINSSVLGKGNVGIEVIPFAAVLHPVSFECTIGVEEVFSTVDGLCSGEGLAVLVVEPLSGVVFRPALRGGGVNGQLDVAVEHSRNLCAGGAGLWIELIVRASHHDACLLHSRYCGFVHAADAGSIRIGGSLTGYGQFIAGGFGVVCEDDRNFLTGNRPVRCKLQIADALHNSFFVRPFDIRSKDAVSFHIGETVCGVGFRVHARQSAKGSHQHSPRHGGVGCEGGF